MCAARSRPIPAPGEDHRMHPPRAFYRRTKPRRAANDNRSRRAGAWRAAGMVLGVAAAGSTALALAMLSL